MPLFFLRRLINNPVLTCFYPIRLSRYLSITTMIVSFIPFFI